MQRYEPEMETAYTIDGRCQAGDLLRIRVPCWRMNEQVVVRGEAELMESGEATGEAAAPVSRPAVSRRTCSGCWPKLARRPKRKRRPSSLPRRGLVLLHLLLLLVFTGWEQEQEQEQE